MRKGILFLCFTFSFLISSDSWAKENIDNKVEDDQRVIDEAWLKNILKRRLSESDQFDLDEIKSRTQKILSKSMPCGPVQKIKDDFNFFILMTFGLSDSLWIEYSAGLEKVNGAFVVQGLPNDSFAAFAKKVKNLREKGVYAPIQLHPKMFDKYRVEQAPSIILAKGDIYDKISGMVSVRYALEKFANEGDVFLAGELLEKILGEN